MPKFGNIRANFANEPPVLDKSTFKNGAFYPVYAFKIKHPTLISPFCQPTLPPSQIAKSICHFVTLCPN